ncbi:type IVa pilus pseudopilin TppE [Noviherbaspirillum agri]
MNASRCSLIARRIAARAQDGFTLIELMVTVAVLSILLAVATPSFENALLGTKLGSYANNLVSSAIVARSEAIKRNATVTLCASADGANCATSGGWQQGWIVMAGTTVIQHQQAVPGGFKITGVDAGSTPTLSLTFQPTGVGATQASFTICRATPTAGSQERVVSISATGRPSTSKTSVGACS